MEPKVFQGRTQAERRKYPRIPLKMWVHFQCLKEGDASPASLESLAEDLGAGGLAMRSDLHLEQGQMLMVTLYLPPAAKRAQPDDTLIYAEGECLTAVVLSRVIWCRPLKDKEFMVGVKFLDLDGESRRSLKDFLKDYQLDQPNPETNL